VEQLNIVGKRSGEGFVAHKAKLVNALSRALADRLLLMDFTRLLRLDKPGTADHDRDKPCQHQYPNQAMDCPQRQNLKERRE
jgi:hypothetical protein